MARAKFEGLNPRQHWYDWSRDHSKTTLPQQSARHWLLLVKQQLANMPTCRPEEKARGSQSTRAPHWAYETVSAPCSRSRTAQTWWLCEDMWSLVQPDGWWHLGGFCWRTNAQTREHILLATVLCSQLVVLNKRYTVDDEELLELMELGVRGSVVTIFQVMTSQLYLVQVAGAGSDDY